MEALTEERRAQVTKMVLTYLLVKEMSKYRIVDLTADVMKTQLGRWSKELVILPEELLEVLKPALEEATHKVREMTSVNLGQIKNILF